MANEIGPKRGTITLIKLAKVWAKSRDPKTFRFRSEDARKAGQVLSVWRARLWQTGAEIQASCTNTSVSSNQAGWVRHMEASLVPQTERHSEEGMLRLTFILDNGHGGINCKSQFVMLLQVQSISACRTPQLKF